MKKNGHGSHKTAKKVILIILAILLILIIGAVGVVFGILGRTNYVKPEDDNEYLSEESIIEEPEEIPSGYEVIEGDDIEVEEPDAVSLKSNKDIMNVLLIGSDTRGTKGGRSDTMLIVSIDKVHGKIKMVSLLRDLYVPIPGKTNNRLNASYSFGGTSLLIKTIENNFKIKIDKYVRVRFQDFIQVIDKVGGVDIKITPAEAKYIGSSTSGKVHLNGNMALKYARIRKLDSDFGRTNRQRTVIKDVIAKAKNMSGAELTSLMYDVLPMVTTNFTSGELLSILTQFGTIREYPVSELAIPLRGEYKGVYIRGMAVLVTDLNQAAKHVQDFIYE